MNYTTPVGFRDVLGDEALEREQLMRTCQDAFAAKGYMPVETPTLEVLDVLQAGGHVPETPFKFFDSHGELLAMRPDVTMQVARMCATRLPEGAEPLKFRYNQRVFREKTAEASARELMQVGVELVRASGIQADVEVVKLFAETLQACGLENYTIALGSAAVLRELLAQSEAPEGWQQSVLQAYHKSNFVELKELVENGQANAAVAEAIFKLPSLRGGTAALQQLRELVEPFGAAQAIDEFEGLYNALLAEGLENKLLVDFSIMTSFDYYTGMVFEAYAPGLGAALGGGGRYDNLLARYGAGQVPAAGFGFYLEQIMEALAEEETAKARPLRIAVPKGALNEDAIRVLTEAGLDTTGLANPGRALRIQNGNVEYIIVRPTDAPIFVATGAADCGLCGEDSLVEAAPDVVELVDLKFGQCRFVVAESEGSTAAVERRYRKLGSIRVATKYPNITRAYFAKKGMQAQVVKLHGNIELAPLTGMAERIVDITATGTTLRENNLAIVDDVLDSTARFFANPCSFRTNPRVAKLADALFEQVKG